MFEIRDAEAGDYQAWRKLWANYLSFYKVELDDAITQKTWRAALEPKAVTTIRVAQVGREVVAFSVFQKQASSWALNDVICLEDLYLEAAHRGKGIGKAMLDDVISIARKTGCSQVFWHTKRDNLPARSLYDQYVNEDGNVRYTLNL